MNLNLNNKLRLINGKFFKEGVEVPIEIGNPEQIQLIKKLQSKKQAFENEGYLADHYIETIFQVNISFHCLCGEFIHKSLDQVGNKRDIYIIADNEKIKCPICKKKYKIISTENNFLIFYDKKN